MNQIRLNQLWFERTQVQLEKRIVIKERSVAESLQNNPGKVFSTKNHFVTEHSSTNHSPLNQTRLKLSWEMNHSITEHSSVNHSFSIESNRLSWETQLKQSWDILHRNIWVLRKNGKDLFTNIKFSYVFRSFYLTPNSGDSKSRDNFIHWRFRSVEMWVRSS